MSPPDHAGPSRSRVFHAVPESLHQVRSFLRERCVEAGISGAPADDIVLAVSEACSNAVLHSHSELFQVVWRFRGDRAEARIRDQGRFRLSSPSTADLGLGGNGIPLMTALMDEVSVRRGTHRRPGTDVRLVKRLEVARGWGRRVRQGSSSMARRPVPGPRHGR